MTTTASTLYSSYTLGRVTLANRIVMSPMTRSRAIGNVANDLMALYYSQRAEAGLIITEATSPSPNGLGYARIPGLFNAQQVEGWKLVTKAVHDAGSRIFVQLMHTGRVTHAGNLPPTGRVLAPSAIAWDSKIWVDGKGQIPLPSPEAMTEKDIHEAIAEFGKGAELAMEAGFDGVELHGANGYLIEQFLNTAANQRTDSWGGSITNRIRFALEVAKTVAKRIGGDRLGFRVSPYGNGGGMKPDDDGIENLHETLAGELRKVGLVYMHVGDHSSMGTPTVTPSVKEKIRKSFGGTIILSGGYDLKRAEADVMAGRGQLIAFGRPFISNPRLPSRLREGLPLAALDPDTLYSADEKGYTDYPLSP